MKKVQITETVSGKIDWDTPQWVQANNNPCLILLTTGGHEDSSFTGMCLPCKDLSLGHFDIGWSKHDFHVLEIDIPFIISNKED